MEPEQKAKDLYNYYLGIIVDDVINMKPCYATLTHKLAKVSALKCLDEILESHYKLLSGINQSVYNYWQEVKKEIENL